MTSKLPIKMEDLRAGKAITRRYRNRRIGEFLKELDLTEGRSTGIPKVLRVMAENGSPAPEFDTDEDRTYFLIRLPVHVHAKAQLEGGSTPHVTPEVGTKFVPSLSQVCPKSVPSDVFIPLLEIASNPIPIEALMKVAEQTNRTRFRKTILRPLLDAGLIEMTIPDKPRSSKQKYRLTAKGRAMVAQMKDQKQIRS